MIRLAALALTFSISFQALADSVVPKGVGLTLEHTTSVEQIMWMLAFTGASSSSLDIVRQDLTKQTANHPLGKISLKGDELFLNGKSVGVRFLSASPLRLQMNGKVWTYHSDQNLEQNYFSLVKFAEGTDHASILQLWLPSAQATDVATTGIIGMLAAGLCYTVFEPCGLLATVGILVVASTAPVGLAWAKYGMARVKIQCFPKYNPPSVVIQTGAGQLKFVKSETGFTSWVQKGKNKWQDAADVVAQDKAGFDTVAGLIGQDPSQCKTVQDSLNDKLAEAIQKDKAYTPLGSPTSETGS